MKVALSQDKSQADVDPEFGAAYRKIQSLLEAGKSAFEQNDVGTLHQIHSQILGSAIDLHNASFFGLTVLEIEKVAKAAASQADIPDHHPV